MKFKKIKWLNIIIILGIVVLLFTPIGRYARGFAGRLLSSGSAVVKRELNLGVDDYNWELTGLDGQSFNLEEAKGKVVFINFWATWCPPCIAEMPSLQKLNDRYGNKVFFLFIAQDDRDKVSEFIKKRGYDLPVYYSNSDAPSLLSSKTLPTTYVLDKNGKIIVAQSGAADWDSEEVHKVLNGLLGQ